MLREKSGQFEGNSGELICGAGVLPAPRKYQRGRRSAAPARRPRAGLRGLASDGQCFRRSEATESRRLQTSQSTPQRQALRSRPPEQPLLPCVDGTYAGPGGARALEKMHGFKKLIKNVCNRLISFSQASELQIHASIEFSFSNQHQTAVPIHDQWCPALDKSFFDNLCSQNRSRTYPVPIFGEPSMHHQAFGAVSGISDGRSAIWRGL